METMGDLLDALRRFNATGYSKEAAEEVFGWTVEDLMVRKERPEVDLVVIQLFDNLIIEARHILSEGLEELRDDWEFRFKLKSDLTSSIRYNAYYSRYIHGQGYLRTDIGYVDNKLLRKMLEDFYIPRLRAIYKPVILEFKGFHSYDFFGIEVYRNKCKLYYSTVRYGRQETSSSIVDVISRLNYLNEMTKDQKFREKLKALDDDLCKVLSILCPSG